MNKGTPKKGESSMTPDEMRDKAVRMFEKGYH